MTVTHAAGYVGCPVTLCLWSASFISFVLSCFWCSAVYQPAWSNLCTFCSSQLIVCLVFCEKSDTFRAPQVNFWVRFSSRFFLDTQNVVLFQQLAEQLVEPSRSFACCLETPLVSPKAYFLYLIRFLLKNCNVHYFALSLPWSLAPAVLELRLFSLGCLGW